MTSILDESFTSDGTTTDWRSLFIGASATPSFFSILDLLKSLRATKGEIQRHQALKRSKKKHIRRKIKNHPLQSNVFYQRNYGKNDKYGFRREG